MSLERLYKLRCDGCGAIARSRLRLNDVYSTPRHARAAAKSDGWARVQKSYGLWQDLCPACLDKLVQEVV